jgi:hypothetical protein
MGDVGEFRFLEQKKNVGITTIKIKVITVTITVTI